MCKSETRGLITFLDLLLEEHKNFKRRVFFSMVLSWIHLMHLACLLLLDSTKSTKTSDFKFDFSACYAYFMAYSRYGQPFLMLILKGYITIPEEIRIFQMEERRVCNSEQHRDWQPGLWVWIWNKNIQPPVLSDLVLEIKLAVCFSLMLKLFAILEGWWYMRVHSGLSLILQWFTIAVRWLMVFERSRCKNICMFLACNKF